MVLTAKQKEECKLIAKNIADAIKNDPVFMNLMVFEGVAYRSAYYWEIEIRKCLVDKDKERTLSYFGLQTACRGVDELKSGLGESFRNLKNSILDSKSEYARSWFENNYNKLKNEIDKETNKVKLFCHKCKFNSIYFYDGFFVDKSLNSFVCGKCVDKYKIKTRKLFSLPKKKLQMLLKINKIKK